MALSSEFKVIIAGGGIAGLTLAILLEKFHIDYLILEARDDIAPPAGASIGMMPNGLLILDQLGCYDAVRAVARSGELDDLHIRDSDGKSMAFTDHFAEHLEKRHGYAMLFFDRQWLLQVLYDKIQHKDRIVLKSQVKKVDCSGSGVQVSTQDGHVYRGAMVVGADGIHSAVRKEMVRIAGGTKPGYFPVGEEDLVPCYYQCSFGIAVDVANWPKHEQSFTTGDHKAFLVTSGPKGRVYWFLFVKLPETKHGKDIPRYTEEDEALFMKKHHALPIRENLTFGQLYAKRITSTLTPLHQVVFEKWFFNRMLLIGDSAHKPNPISGMGANGAMESVAEFVNALLEKRDERKNGLSGLSTGDINAICHKMQSVRHDRAKLTVSASEKMQALLAFEKPKISFLVWRVFGPLAGDDSPLRILGGRTLGGSRVKALPVPFRPRAVPYHHELPAKPISNGRAMLFRLGYAVVMGFLFWVSLSSHQGHYTIESDLASALPLVYLLSQSISPLLIYTIEGHRAGNEGTPSSLTFPYTVGLQVLGICRALPLLALLTASLPFDAPAGRFVSHDVGKSLVPALTCGYIFPTLFMLASSAISGGVYESTGLLQMVPLFLPISMAAFSSVFKWCQRKIQKSYLDRYSASDVPVLQFAYGFAFAIQATAHLSTLSYYLYFHPEMCDAILLGLSPPIESGMGLQLLSCFPRSDVTLTIATITVYSLYAVWDLRRSGYMTTRDTIMASLCVTLGQVTVGPGATWAGLWSYREGVISGLSSA
ncbi:FAD binding domain protein, partial [Thelonectria olida]